VVVVVVVGGCGGGSSNLMLRPLAAPGGRLHKMTSDECYDDVWWCLTRGPRNATTISVQVFCEGKPQKKATLFPLGYAPHVGLTPHHSVVM
jgi:hypothetical protein